MRIRLWQVVYFLFILVFFFPSIGYAYIDPGTGSMLLQMIGMAFIAIGGVWVVFKNRIKSFFSRKKDAPKDEE